MKLALPKSFLMMKLLNRSYPAPIRVCLAMTAFGIAGLATGRLALARELYRQCWYQRDLKITARRAAWYTRRGWLGLDVMRDDFFDPTEGMDNAQLNALQSFVVSRKSRLNAMVFAADMAIIAARRLNNNQAPDAKAHNVNAFESACNMLLAQTTPPPHDTSSETKRTGDFPIENAKKTLSDFAALFPPAQLRWFVISGTFLGLIREKGFLTHDYDIDLGVFDDACDTQAILETVASSDKFVLKKYDFHQSTLFSPQPDIRNTDSPYIIKLVHVTGIHIDLFIHYRDTRTEPAIDWHGSSLHRWENSAFDLIPYSFYDQMVLGPADADRYLTENYGDWRTPVTDFNCTTDTPNLALVPHPIAIVIFVLRYTMARQNDPDQARKLESELLHNGFLKRNAGGPPSFAGDLFAA